MKKVLFAVLLLATVVLQAQFRNSPAERRTPGEGIVNSNSNLLFGFIDPAKFSMSHSYSLSYGMGGGNALALGVYTNTMRYAFNDKLNLRVDANVVHSPYSTFGKNVTDQINGIYIGNAELNYKPTDNFFISLQYRNLPGYGYGYGGYGYDGMFGSRFNNSFFGDSYSAEHP